MSFKIPKPNRILPVHRALARKIEPMVERINRGHVVESQTVRVVRLPDGRIQLFLKQ